MRKRLGVILGLLIAVVLLAATAQAGTRGSKVTTITLSGWSSGPDEDALLQQVVNNFNKSHSSIHVDYAVINGDYGTSMTARFAAHNPPDVFYVDSSVAGLWAQQGVLEPLNSYIKSSKYDTSKFFPSLLGAFTVGKTIYGFPKDWSPLAMEINKGMLGRRQGADQLGVAPEDRADDGEQGRHARRQADLPLARLGAHAGLRLPGRRLALEHHLAGRRSGGELLRRADEQGPRDDAGQARLRMVR